MSEIDRLIAEHCPDGVEFEPLRDVGTWYGGGTPSKSRPEYWQDGTIPWLSPKDMTAGTLSATEDRIASAAIESSAAKLVPAGSVAFVVRSNILRRRLPVARVPFATTMNQDMRAVIPRDGIDLGYLALVCRAKSDSILASAGRTDGSMAAIGGPGLLEFKIPVPPLPIQHALAEMLDKTEGLHAELQAELEAELEARTRQYEHYRDQVLRMSSSVPIGRVRDFVDFSNARAHEKLVDPAGTVALMTARFISRGEANRFVRPEDVRTPAYEGDVALVMSDLPNGKALAKTFYVDSDNTYAANQRVCLLRSRDPSVLLPRFLHRVMNRNPQLLAYNNGIDQTHLKKDGILEVRIPIPPAEDQERVVAILDRLDSVSVELAGCIASELSARRKQYEYYRDKLLTFAERAA
jgi:type I restriction enzyme S subunit